MRTSPSRARGTAFAAENVKRATEAHLSFYGQVFGFEPADDVEPVEIEKLDSVPQ